MTKLGNVVFYVRDQATSIDSNGDAMPRIARAYLPGYPYHLIQRDNNRDAPQQIIEHGIFHGIDTFDHRKIPAVTGFPRAIFNRVGVTGTERHILAMAGITAGLVSQKISDDIHFLVGDADNINAFLAHQIKDNVLALRETVIALSYIRAVFAQFRVVG